jgi:hypothetical protein
VKGRALGSAKRAVVIRIDGMLGAHDFADAGSCGRTHDGSKVHRILQTCEDDEITRCQWVRTKDARGLALWTFEDPDDALRGLDGRDRAENVRDDGINRNPGGSGLLDQLQDLRVSAVDLREKCLSVKTRDERLAHEVDPVRNGTPRAGIRAVWREPPDPRT